MVTFFFQYIQFSKQNRFLAKRYNNEGFINGPNWRNGRTNMGNAGTYKTRGAVFTANVQYWVRSTC